MVSILMLGFVMGMRHALDADHVAAVAALSTRSESWRANAVRGSVWGLGHMIMLSAVGGLCLLFETAVSEQWARRLELAAGVMLLVLGGDLLWRLVRRRIHVHVHRHDDGTVHWHAHGHPAEEPSASHRHEHVHSDTGIIHTHEHRHHDHRHGHKSIFVGMVHGMAGSGALMLAVLSSIESVPMGLAYIAIFGAGSIASMAAMSALIGLPFSRAGDYRRLNLALRYMAAAITLAIGIGLVYELGIIERVFF